MFFICIVYFSPRSKGPEQDQLPSPFVPYVRNTAERSIHNFDSQPYIYICTVYCIHTYILEYHGNIYRGVRTLTGFILGK